VKYACSVVSFIGAGAGTLIPFGSTTAAATGAADSAVNK